MNDYRKAMEQCVPPANLEERLQQRLQAAAPPRKITVIRPWSFARRAVLAAALALAFTASVGATVLLDWDDIFASRFGAASATLPIAETAFQKVNVTSVCDDVRLTIREVLGDNKTIYLILDYQLPESVDRAAVQAAWDSEYDSVGCPSVNYYATGAVTWEAFQAEHADGWVDADWTDHSSYRFYHNETSSLYKYRFYSGGSNAVETKSYDVETGTLTYLLQFTTESSTQNLTDQPLTLVLFPPLMTVDGVVSALADQPALITFQPEYTARARSGKVQAKDGSYTAEAIVSPFAISVEYYGSGYGNVSELREDTILVFKDGHTATVTALTSGFGGGGSVSDANESAYQQYTSHFRDILDSEQVTAVRIGKIKIPLHSDIIA